jgi:hypothetical protein
MANIGLDFERVYIRKPKSSCENQINQLILIENMLTVLKFTCDRNLPQLLHESPKTVDEIASEIDVQPLPLQRLLRSLSAIGYYSYNSETKLWSNSSYSELFLAEYKIVLDFYQDQSFRPLHMLIPKALEHDKTMFEVAGLPPFDFSDRDFLNKIHIFMDASTRIAMKRLENHLEFPGYKSVIDIGGSTGTLLEYIHAKNPNMRLASFDVPLLREKTIEKLREANIENAEFIGGDFFESIPPGFDVYVLKHILHNWNDEKSCIILRNVRKAISENGLLVVIEFIITDENSTGRFCKFDDVEMVIAINGEGRSEKQYLDLFEQTGFQLKKVKYDSEQVSILYCEPK